MIVDHDAEPHPETMKKKKPHIKQITQIFLFFLRVSSRFIFMGEKGGGRTNHFPINLATRLWSLRKFLHEKMLFLVLLKQQMRIQLHLN
jgi:hypothetical protein